MLYTIPSNTGLYFSANRQSMVNFSKLEKLGDCGVATDSTEMINNQYVVDDLGNRQDEPIIA